MNQAEYLTTIFDQVLKFPEDLARSVFQTNYLQRKFGDPICSINCSCTKCSDASARLAELEAERIEYEKHCIYHLCKNCRCQIWRDSRKKEKRETYCYDCRDGGYLDFYLERRHMRKLQRLIVASGAESEKDYIIKLIKAQIE